MSSRAGSRLYVRIHKPTGGTDHGELSIGGLGAAVVDGGNPCGTSKTVAKDGNVKDGGSGITGYSVLKAESLEAAVKLAKGCPLLKAGGSVEVYETINAM